MAAVQGKQKKKRNKIVVNDGPVSDDCIPCGLASGNGSFSYDEVPIAKAGPSEFQALLERELARERAAADAREVSVPDSVTRKTTFLKRGSGSGPGKAEAQKRRSFNGSGSALMAGQRLPFAERGNNSQQPSQCVRAAQDGSENASEYSEMRSSLSGDRLNRGEHLAVPISRPSTAPTRQQQPVAHPWDDKPVGGVCPVANAWDEVPIGGHAARGSLPCRNSMNGLKQTVASERTSLAARVQGQDRSMLEAVDDEKGRRQGALRPVARKLQIEDDKTGRAAQRLSIAAASIQMLPRNAKGLAVDASRSSTVHRIEQELEEEELREFESLERRVREEGDEDDELLAGQGEDDYDEDFEAESKTNQTASGLQYEGEDDEDAPWADETFDNAGNLNLTSTGSVHELHHTSNFFRGSQRASETRDSEEWERPIEFQNTMSLAHAPVRVHESSNSTLPSPPRSALVNKLFSGGKTVKNNKKEADKHQRQEQQQQQSSSASYVDERVSELESEIKEFKRQNKLLQDLRAEAEQEREMLREEQGKIADHWREAEERFERFRDAEEKKMKKDRKETDKHVQIYHAQVLELKAERDALRREISAAQAESAKREKKLKMELERIRQQLEDATQRNAELQRELKFSEEARIAQEDRRQLKEQQSRLVMPKSVHGASRCLMMGSPSTKEEIAEKIAEQAVGDRVDEKTLADLDRDILSLSTHEMTMDRSVMDGTCFSDRTLEIDAINMRRKASPHSANLGVHGNSTSSGVSSAHPSQSHHQGQQPGKQKQIEREQESAVRDDQHQQPGKQKHPQKEQEPAVRDEQQDQGAIVTQEIHHGDGKIERHLSDGRKVIIFSNGTRKEILKEGGSVVHFSNNDFKRSYADGKVVYFYAETRTTHTTYSSGLEVFEFANKQQEKHFPDGRKEILFPDSTLKVIHPTGEEDSVFPDGTVQRTTRDGTRVIEFTNGHRETLTPDGIKVRELPNGSVRKVYADGRTETIRQSVK